MNEDQLKEFEIIARQCESGGYRSINVGSKLRSDAIVAVWYELKQLRDFYRTQIKQGEKNE